MPRRDIPSENARQFAESAFVFGYPLLLMDVMRQQMTAVPMVTSNRAPVNQFAHMREFPDHTSREITNPTVDTLDSFAWLDLSREPVVLSVPDVAGRYYAIQMIDAWTNIFLSVGSRTTGNGRADFGIHGPHWQGPLPRNVLPIAAPTTMVWLIARTQADGNADLPAVHAIQQHYTLTPLGAWEKSFTPPTSVPVSQSVDGRTPATAQVARLTAAGFLARLNALLTSNPPGPHDAAMMACLRDIGVEPGERFDMNAFRPDVQQALEEGVKAGHAHVLAEARKPRGAVLNGWHLLPWETGRCGTEYQWRAAAALKGPGTPLPADTTCAQAATDADHDRLTGERRYAIRFSRSQLPPVRAFWSITVYDARRAFTPNVIGRYALRSRDGLTFDDDGSLTLYVQADRPEPAKEPNWLPAPRETFSLAMRLFWPALEILEETWIIPPVMRAG